MDKTLKPYTIIPQNLYVERSADRQIENIINDMGRPGYILVARQMGKTNLLLNAKRTLETKNDVFSYIDLSNKFDTARECFRNIIDVIIDSNLEKLEPILETISSKRQKTSLSAAKEHTFELRAVLKEISGKLIIFLDEIDSLTLADYSDKIFAQIRSVYFDRINISEFENLSYVLSGVAEPSEIIKDRSISPFNIGQKIYLGDFSLEEFDGFISQSGLQIPTNIRNRIFYWVNGNPRLTWELCSEVEDRLLSNSKINIETIDKIVKEMYLSNFDRPPVDHIRSLIQSHKDLRQGVISIIYGKEKTLSNKVKNRLYLAGILDSNYEKGKIKIKNKIIKEALDETWIEEIEDEKAVTLASANAYYSDNKFDQAALVFKDLIANVDISKIEKDVIKYKLGICYYNLNENAKAIHYLEARQFDKDAYKADYIHQLYMLGVCYHESDALNDAIDKFKEIIDFGPQKRYYYESIVNLASALIQSDPEKNKKEVIKLNNSVIDENSKNTPEKSKVVALAYKNLGMLHEMEGENKKAFNLYITAANESDGVNKFNPLVLAFKVKEEGGELLFPELINTIKTFKKEVNDFPSKTIDKINRRSLVSLITTAIYRKYYTGLEDLLEILSGLTDEALWLSELLSEVLVEVMTSNNRDSLQYVLNKISSMDRAFVSPENSFIVSKFQSFFDENDLNASKNYFQGYQNYVEKPDGLDVFLFERKIKYYKKNNQHDKSIYLINRMLSSHKNPSYELKVLLIPIYYLQVVCMGENSDNLHFAKDLKNLLLQVDKNDLKLISLDKTRLEVLKNEVNQLIAKYPVEQVISKIKYGRNQKVIVEYEDGTVLIKKYKLVKGDIDSGLCMIIKDSAKEK